MSRRRHPRQPLIPPGRIQLVTGQRDAQLVRDVQLAEHLHRTGSVNAAVVVYYGVIKRCGPRFLEHAAGRRAAFLAGLAAYQLRIYDEAVWFLEAVRDHEWQNADVHYNLGLLYHASRAPDKAADAYRTALAIRPEHAAALNNLGNALRELGDADAAEACYQQLMAADPQDAHARYNLAHVLLLRGDLARGFRLYEDRWRVDAWIAEYGRPDIRSPRLTRDSSPTPGARILVHQEQGLGDTLQFLRYLHVLWRLGYRVTFEAPVELGAWLRGIERSDLSVITRGEPLPEHDLHIPLLSLPAYLGIAGESDIPPRLDIPVRRPSPLWTAPGDTRPVVGFAWAGNASHHADHHRTVPLRDLAALFSRPNTRFVSLQVGERAVELLRALPELRLGEGSEILDPSARLADFEDTAALVQRCDAVVTVDTSIAHLAGTLGARTYVLLNWLSEWRWQLGRTDSPWYPAVHLVRQPSLGDWPAVARETLTLLEDL